MDLGSKPGPRCEESLVLLGLQLWDIVLQPEYLSWQLCVEAVYCQVAG